MLWVEWLERMELVKINYNSLIISMDLQIQSTSVRIALGKFSAWAWFR